MIRSVFEQRPLDAAVADAGSATLEFDRARAWLRSALVGAVEPLGAEVWVLNTALEQIVLVRHPWRGMVPPGGKVEPGECPRDVAARELAEETGLRPGCWSGPQRWRYGRSARVCRRRSIRSRPWVWRNRALSSGVQARLRSATTIWLVVTPRLQPWAVDSLMCRSSPVRRAT
ncbi:NUDIX domain-containing protein [Streptomyces sp. NPDC056944]|uniref:NUDIX domain-containing protein n=1 Tax=Streptomyces sp. NPDC056944 TaxID=3345972 RepID=UPI00362DE6C2